VRKAVLLTRLDQSWDMFAPYPYKDDGWYIMPGRLEGGRVVDVFRGGAAVDEAKPRSVSALYRNIRWRKYLMDLRRRRNFALGAYAAYVCREWNRSYKGPDALASFEVVFMRERARYGKKEGPPRRTSLGRYRCVENGAVPAR
jgi:hypothetical protein